MIVQKGVMCLPGPPSWRISDLLLLLFKNYFPVFLAEIEVNGVMRVFVADLITERISSACRINNSFTLTHKFIYRSYTILFDVIHSLTIHVLNLIFPKDIDLIMQGRLFIYLH